MPSILFQGKDIPVLKVFGIEGIDLRPSFSITVSKKHLPHRTFITLEDRFLLALSRSHTKTLFATEIVDSIEKHQLEIKGESELFKLSFRKKNIFSSPHTLHDFIESLFKSHDIQYTQIHIPSFAKISIENTLTPAFQTPFEGLKEKLSALNLHFYLSLSHSSFFILKSTETSLFQESFLNPHHFSQKINRRGEITQLIKKTPFFKEEGLFYLDCKGERFFSKETKTEFHLHKIPLRQTAHLVKNIQRLHSSNASFFWEGVSERPDESNLNESSFKQKTRPLKQHPSQTKWSGETRNTLNLSLHPQEKPIQLGCFSKPHPQLKTLQHQPFQFSIDTDDTVLFSEEKQGLCLSSNRLFVSSDNTRSNSNSISIGTDRFHCHVRSSLRLHAENTFSLEAQKVAHTLKKQSMQTHKISMTFNQYQKKAQTLSLNAQEILLQSSHAQFNMQKACHLFFEKLTIASDGLIQIGDSSQKITLCPSGEVILSGESIALDFQSIRLFGQINTQETMTPPKHWLSKVSALDLSLKKEEIETSTLVIELKNNLGSPFLKAAQGHLRIFRNKQCIFQSIKPNQSGLILYKDIPQGKAVFKLKSDTPLPEQPSAYYEFFGPSIRTEHHFLIQNSKETLRVLPPPMVLNLRNNRASNPPFWHIFLDYARKNNNRLTLFIHGFNVRHKQFSKYFSDFKLSTAFLHDFQPILIPIESEDNATTFRCFHDFKENAPWIARYEDTLPFSPLSKDEYVNGEEDHSWIIHFEHQLNLSAGYQGPKDTRFHRLLHILWEGDPKHPMDYNQTRKTVEKTAQSLFFIIQMLKKEGVQIDILAHSLGCGVTVKLMQYLGIEMEKKQPPIFNQIILWQAALPHTVFDPVSMPPFQNKKDKKTWVRQHSNFWLVPDALKSTQKITVIHSQNDNVLGPLMRHNLHQKEINAEKDFLDEELPAILFQHLGLKSIYGLAEWSGVVPSRLFEAQYRKTFYEQWVQKHPCDKKGQDFPQTLKKALENQPLMLRKQLNTLSEINIILETLERTPYHPIAALGYAGPSPKTRKNIHKIKVLNQTEVLYGHIAMKNPSKKHARALFDPLIGGDFGFQSFGRYHLKAPR